MKSNKIRRENGFITADTMQTQRILRLTLKAFPQDWKILEDQPFSGYTALSRVKSRWDKELKQTNKEEDNRSSHWMSLSHTLNHNQNQNHNQKQSQTKSETKQKTQKMLFWHKSLRYFQFGSSNPPQLILENRNRMNIGRSILWGYAFHWYKPQNTQKRR